MDDHLPLCDSFNCNLCCLNFSSQYPYIIQQTDNKNTQNYQPEERVDNSDHGSERVYQWHNYLSVIMSLQSFFNRLVPTSDQDIISRYNINTMSTRYVMRMKKNFDLGIIS